MGKPLDINYVIGLLAYAQKQFADTDYDLYCILEEVIEHIADSI